MSITRTSPTTPITSRADRSDERVRLIEESVLMIRGDWPALASGLCEQVNRAAGLLFSPAAELEAAIATTAEESLRLVDRLYGLDAVIEVRHLAALGRTAEQEVPPTLNRQRPRHRLHLHRHRRPTPGGRIPSPGSTVR